MIRLWIDAISRLLRSVPASLADSRGDPDLLVDPPVGIRLSAKQVLADPEARGAAVALLPVVDRATEMFRYAESRRV